MKDSGVEWLGEVPAHWGVRRGKWLFRHRKQINADSEETNVLSLTLRGVVNNDPENPEGLVPKDYATYQLFRKGDLVFKLIDLENLQTSRVGLVHEDGIMSSAYVRLTSKVILDVHFFYQQYFDLYQRGIYNQLGAGVRSTLGPYDLLELKVLLPSFSEQAKIVRYLDYVGQRVQQFVQAKQKLIRLLEEQKQAIIHRAVTRGLDPDVPLKDSGVKWLGKVPEHWEVTRLKWRLRKNDSGVWGDDFSDAGTIVLRSTEQTIIGGWKITSPARISLPAAAVASALLKAGDLVVTKSSGSQAHIGKTSLVDDEVARMHCCFSNFMQRLRLDTESNPAYMWYNLNSPVGREQLIFQSTTTTGLGNLNGTILGNCQFAFPSLLEQTAIVEYLDSATADINTAIARVHREIDLLQEYRTRLTADVVTGKVDVQDTAANLPDEACVSALLCEPDVPETKTDTTVEESQA